MLEAVAPGIQHPAVVGVGHGDDAGVPLPGSARGPSEGVDVGRRDRGSCLPVPPGGPGRTGDDRPRPDADDLTEREGVPFGAPARPRPLQVRGRESELRGLALQTQPLPRAVHREAGGRCLRLEAAGSRGGPGWMETLVLRLAVKRRGAVPTSGEPRPGLDHGRGSAGCLGFRCPIPCSPDPQEPTYSKLVPR